MVFKEYKTFRECCEAVGNYGGLYNLLTALDKMGCIVMKEDHLDGEYARVQRAIFDELLAMFRIDDITYAEEELLDELFGSVGFEQPNFKYECLKFIVKEILPHRKGW